MRQIKLNKTKSVESINKDVFLPLGVSSKNKLLPSSEIYKIIDTSEIFVMEKNKGDLFRLSVTVNPLFTNILTNIIGPDSLSTYNEDRFKNRESPANASLHLKDNLTYRTSLQLNKLNNNGWVGYYNPELFTNDCKQIDLHPKRDEMNILGAGGIKNWDVCVTYPYLSENHPLVSNGIKISDFEVVEYSGRDMVRFSTDFNHGLKIGDKVFIDQLSDPALNGEYFVYNVGDGGEMRDNYFLVEISGVFTLTPSTTMKRMSNGRKSKYYFRVFKKVKMLNSPIMENDDYEIFQMGFANNVFGDNIIQINFSEEIDLSGLTDNLKRPITELFVTFIKKSDALFSKVKSGFNLNYLPGSDNSIPDIKKINNDPSSTHNPLETQISINQDTYYGDLVEFNDYDHVEVILNEVNHRFNTNNRDTGGMITSDGATLVMGKRFEGYYYKPHHSIKVRELSDYVEQGVLTDDKPDYAVSLGDGRFLWRDVYDYAVAPNLDIPFLNGCHYVNKLINLHLKRQDPFGLYGLYYNTFPRDVNGVELENNEIKTNTNDCF